MMRKALLMCGVAVVVLAAVAFAKDYQRYTTPQGQAFVVVGEARDRSNVLEQGQAMGFLARAPVKSFVEIEQLRAANLMIAATIDLSASNDVLNWPAGQWIECVLTDGTVHRARRVFTSGPQYELRVINLGREAVRIPRGALYCAQVPGVNFVGPPIYIAVPNASVRGANGRTYGMGVRDITSIRFVQLPVDSIGAVAERR